MKHWLETRQVFEQLERWRSAGVAAALATVVRVRGSAYRHEGAKLAVAVDGSYLGNVSGGCLELDVRDVARDVIAGGRPQLRRYCSRLDEIKAWDLGVGCEGEVEIWIEPARAPRDTALHLLDGDDAFASCTLIEGDGDGHSHWTVAVGAPRSGMPPAVATAFDQVVGTGRSALVDHADGAVFVDLFRPPPVLAIIGAGDDARPLARLAIELGFRVTVIDRRPGLLTAERFPGATLLVDRGETLPGSLNRPADSYVVLMTHQYADDATAGAALTALPLPYLGILGPRQRTDRLLSSLGPAIGGFADIVHAPVGLDIGAEGAEQVAVSILAEIMALRSARHPAPLRERDATIHAAVD